MERSLRPKTDKDFGAPPPGYVAGRGRGAGGFASGVSRNGPVRQEEEKEVDLGDSNYDEFAGYSGSLFPTGAFDKEDDEADRIYDMVDARMESRRKRARQEQEQQELAKLRAETPNLQQQFLDLKRELVTVSEEQWMQLPTAHERLKAKRVQKESYSNVTDSMILGAPPGMPSSMTEVGEAKRAVLSITLDKDTSSAGVDAAEYLRELSEKGSEVFSDIAEVKKARLLFKSVTRADPSNPTGWIAAARLEESLGNSEEAKTVVARALSNCASSEDLWLMAARLELQDKGKVKAIVANGIRKIPRSVKLWQEAANQEEKKENKVRVLQKALEIVPSSVTLWKSLINLTSSEEPQVLLLLERAVECCPDSEELWLTYAKMSDFEKAQKILNDARKAIPSSVAVWVAAAELAEAMHGSENVIRGILTKGIESLRKNGVILDKQAWLETASKSLSSFTLKSSDNTKRLVPICLTQIAISSYIDAQISRGVDPKYVKREILRDHQTFKSLLSVLVAETVLSTAVHETVLRERKGLWRTYLEYLLSKNVHFDASRIDFQFSQAVHACPHAEVLWLMYAKFLWAKVGNANKAREVLQSAMQAVNNSEDIYIAAARIEESFSEESTRSILLKGRSQCPKACRLWVKAAQLERKAGNVEAIISVCEEGLEKIGKKNPEAFKLYIIPCHALVASGRLDQAFAFAGKACEACPSKGPVWAVAADIAIAQEDFNRARSVLERGRVRLPSEELLWWKGFIVEQLCHGQTSSSARVFLSRGLQACSNSGILWACAIESEPVATRHPKCLDALKRCPNDPIVVCSIAKFFWIEKLQIDKARKWFLNALEIGKQFGQVWADIIAFESSLGDENLYNLDLVLNQFSGIDEGSVNKGFLWNEFRKNILYWNLPVKQIIIKFAQKRYPDIFSKDSFPNTNLRLERFFAIEPLKTEQ